MDRGMVERPQLFSSKDAYSDVTIRCVSLRAAPFSCPRPHAKRLFDFDEGRRKFSTVFHGSVSISVSYSRQIIPKETSHRLHGEFTYDIIFK